MLLGGRGRTLVLLHGLGASLEWWEQVAALLAGEYSVLVPDLPGHGLSDEPTEGYTLALGRSTVARLLDAMDAPAAVVVGNSMGGLVALDFAFHHPDRVFALVLVGAAGFGRSLGLPLRLASLPGVAGSALVLTRRVWLARLAFGQLFCDPRCMPEPWLKRVVALSRRGSYRRSFVGCLRFGVGVGGLKRSIAAEVRARSPELRAPTLLLWGEQDTVVPVNQARAGARLIPNARLAVLPRCGHVPQLELPQETYACIGSFLRDALPR